MSEVLVPLLDLPALGKTPSGKLPSKADFLSCYGALLVAILWGFKVRFTSCGARAVGESIGKNQKVEPCQYKPHNRAGQTVAEVSTF